MENNVFLSCRESKAWFPQDCHPINFLADDPSRALGAKVVRHIRFLAPLAFLSPRIVAAIANGDVSAGVTVSGLVRSLPNFSAEWREKQ
jgi:hypothetical protein